MKNDCELISKKNKINFFWNSKFPINSLYIMRGYLTVKESKKKEYLDTFFNAYWQDNLDLTLEENIIGLIKNLNMNHIEFFKDALKLGKKLIVCIPSDEVLYNYKKRRLTKQNLF